MELPPLRCVGGVPYRGHPYDFEPWRVPRVHWERAKRQFLERGGLNGAEQIASFVSHLTNTDVLPQVLCQRLEELCTDETRVLVKVLENLRQGSHQMATARKSSLTGRKFTSFRHATDNPRTPRGSFRLTPRRSSLQHASAEENVVPPLSLAPMPMDAPHDVSRSTSTLRISVDIGNASVVAHTITQLMPLDLISEVTSLTPDISQQLQAFAKGKSTCHPRRGTGTLTLEQFGLLLSFFACPTNPTSDALGGTINENDEPLEALLAALPEDGTEPTVVEAMLVSIGIAPSQMKSALVPTDSPTSAGGRWVGFRGQIREILQEQQVEGEDDVLQRRTPTRRRNSARVFFPSHNGEVDPTTEAAPMIEFSQHSLSRYEKSLGGSLQHAGSMSLGGPSVLSSVSGQTPRRTPRTPMELSVAEKSLEASQALTKDPKSHLLMDGAPRSACVDAAIPLPVERCTVGTQTDAVSFTLMWLGPVVQSQGTSTQRSGHVGKVVSLELLRRKRHAMKRAERGLAAKTSFEALCKLPVPQLQEMYDSMVVKQRIKTHNSQQ